MSNSATCSKVIDTLRPRRMRYSASRYSCISILRFAMICPPKKAAVWRVTKEPKCPDETLYAGSITRSQGGSINRSPTGSIRRSWIGSNTPILEWLQCSDRGQRTTTRHCCSLADCATGAVTIGPAADGCGQSHHVRLPKSRDAVYRALTVQKHFE